MEKKDTPKHVPLPMFMSGKILHKDDCTKMGEFAKEYLKVKQEFTKNGR